METQMETQKTHTLRGPERGLVRLRVETRPGRWMQVGPFQALGGAQRLAEDLATDAGVLAVRVEHRNRGTWRPAWSFLATAGLVLATLAGCGTAQDWRAAGRLLSAPGCGADGGTIDPGTGACVGRRPAPTTTVCRRTGDVVRCETTR